MVVRDLKELSAGCDEILLATDPDREGEAIAWHLAKVLKIDPDSKCRITFNEITKSAVQEAIKNPRAIDMNLANAQQARRVLDRLVGYELSPLLWQKVRKGLSAGRVQSVATKIVMVPHPASSPISSFSVTTDILKAARPLRMNSGMRKMPSAY